MQIKNNNISPLLLTAAFGLCAVVAGSRISPAAPMHPMKKPMGSAALIAEGKGIAENNGCNTCHGANYGGKAHFSPSIRSNGILHKYSKATFERVMNTGETEDGGHVKKPMPVYHMDAKKSVPLYAFLKSLK